MSVIFQTNDVLLVNHQDYLRKIYNKVNTETSSSSFKILTHLFNIASDSDGQSKKRSYDHDDVSEETNLLKKKFNTFINEVPDNVKGELLSWNVLNSSSVRDLAKDLFHATDFDHVGITGGNNSPDSLKCIIKNNAFLIPPYCRFQCGDVIEQCKKLCGTKFDLLVADPPWWNKYIRRLKAADDKLSYSMMYNEDIASIPVQPLLNEDCCVAVWCTNSPTNICAVKDVIFPKWGVKYAATWYWVKIQTSMQPVGAFAGGTRKQPYERILLGTVGNVRDIPDNKVIVSVPSALHSHKPPLIEILKAYVTKEQPKSLELFARYLLPHTTSIGYECLKWQHISLYESVT